VKNTRKKIFIASALTILIIAAIGNQFFYKKVGSYKITDELNLVISQDGFLSCGEIIRITKTEFRIFDKELNYDNRQCLIGINNVETVRFDKNGAEFLIYHNGNIDSENPYKYEIDNKNVW
jgi:ABC-2 type transport system permease protein